MNRREIANILKTNQLFYKKTANSFSATRKGFWEGWTKTLPSLSFPVYSTIRVLDLGCGNGRFLGFLEKQLPGQDIRYFGVDTSTGLLEDARKTYPLAKFIKKDAVLSLEMSEVGQYDLVACFGLAHHVPDEKLRLQFFKNLGKMPAVGGFLVVTMWDFNTNKGVPAEVEENSYFLFWDKNTELKRFCHLYTAEEKENIVRIMGREGLKLISSFRADGKKGDSNHYFIFRKLATIDL